MDKGDVSRTLCGLGLLPSSVCYFYMAEALRLSLREPDRLLLVTKHVYPEWRAALTQTGSAWSVACAALQTLPGTRHRRSCQSSHIDT